jgi:hypothetical protein
MAKKLVTILGVVFLLIGVLGFIPGITTDGHLLGIFGVDAVHNVVHLLSGILALVFANRGELSAKAFAKVFGIVYGLVALLGLIAPGTLNMIMHVNGADNALHVFLAVVFLAIGYSGRSESRPMM